jgi:ribokinase
MIHYGETVVNEKERTDGVVVLGSINQDIMISVDTMPRPGETIASHGIRTTLGGKGANQAIAASRAGAVTKMLGAVGNDGAGCSALSFLSGHLDTSAVITKADQPTGIAHILSASDGENMIVVTSGANTALGVEDVASVPPVAGVYLAQLETPIDVVERFFTLAREAGNDSLTVLNAAPSCLEAKRLLPLVDILIINETELAIFGEVRALPTKVPAIIELARGLRVDEQQTVIVTRGVAGSLTINSDGVLTVAAYEADVVDTTGAGDCFCGVLGASLAQGLQLEDAIRRAHLAASILVGRRGAAEQMPSAAEIDGTRGAVA